MNNINPYGYYGEVNIKVVNESLNGMPEYKKMGDAGMDLAANEKTTIENGKVKVIKTGLKISLPVGYEAQIRSRSGLASRGIFIMNSPGTIDSGYRGEIGIILANFSGASFDVNVGDRIAQMVISKYEKANLITVSKLDISERGDSGFGSTGI